MASISSLGVGSNLDLSGLLKSLENSEKQPLLGLKAQADSYTTKLSAYGKLQDALAALKTASTKLGNLDLFQGAKASSSFTTVLTASATSSAVAGNYAIKVSQLAQAHSLATAGQVDPKAAIGTGAGNITIDFGTFTPADAVLGTPASYVLNASRKPVVIAYDASNSSLEGIRDAVNAAKGGVTASIVNDGSGTPNRLVLTSDETGEPSSMKISVSGSNTDLGNFLTHDPLGASAMKETSAAQNAKLTVNGLDISSATNTVSESLQGVTLSLVKAGESTLTVARDTASISTAVNAFITAYNALLSTGKALTAYDPDTKTGSPLTGDSTLRILQVRIREALITPQAAGSSSDLTMLSDIGVSFQKDGTLALDATKLEKALSTNLEGVGKLFGGTATDKAGFGKQLTALTESLTGKGGSLLVATEGLTASIKKLDLQYDAMETRINSTVDRYRAQFTQLDVLMSKMNNTKAYLTSQFDAMNAGK
ncbi:flagellar filament capping protein FliD [Polaromonas sp. UC242_47]|uniref:flagellar filament capping protein FliD n=1 Tax=Polaromonas sp. UC242_47 TaxID=3374626 RepID=UPI0037A05B23